MRADSQVPVADLSAQLDSSLLRVAVVLVAIALVTVLGTYAFQQRFPAAAAAVRNRLWDPTVTEPKPRRVLRIGLGVLWVVDGLLQAQPSMPGGFVSQVIAPSLDGSPGWLSGAAQPLLRAWARHPITADAVTVWVQVGLGLLILLGAAGGLLLRAALWLSIGWSLLVWVFGEALGGITAPGASWLAGAPGAVLLYAAAAAVLLASGADRTGVTVARLSRWVAATWLLIGAVLQAIPWEKNFTGDALADPFRGALVHAQPEYLLRPIRGVLSVVQAHPVLSNAILIGTLTVLGAALCSSASRIVLVTALIGCAATWWLAQDFGVIGGYGTDPNSAVPLALLIVVAWPGLVTDPTAAGIDARRRPDGSWRAPTRVGLSAVGLAATLAVPLLALVVLPASADASAVLADSGGGVIQLAGRSAPDFTLTDQRGQSVSLADTRGSLTLVTFLDPVCSDDCPVIANQIAEAVRGLGAAASQVRIIAIDSNPLFHTVADVAAFTTSHGLADLPGWHFVAGPEPEVRSVLDAYGIVVQVPSVGMISHSEGIYFLDRSGREVAYLADGANPELGSSYSQAIRQQISKLLG